jgi:hypothetical protein
VREPVEAAHRRQPSIDRRRREPASFHVLTEQLDVRACRGEHLESDGPGPGEEESEILSVGLQRSAAVTGEKRHRSQLRFVDVACDKHLI